MATGRGEGWIPLEAPIAVMEKVVHLTNLLSLSFCSGIEAQRDWCFLNLCEEINLWIPGTFFFLWYLQKIDTPIFCHANILLIGIPKHYSSGSSTVFIPYLLPYCYYHSVTENSRSTCLCTLVRTILHPKCLLHKPPFFLFVHRCQTCIAIQRISEPTSCYFCLFFVDIPLIYLLYLQSHLGICFSATKEILSKDLWSNTY